MQADAHPAQPPPVTLVWVDLETTGLDPTSCGILEVAFVATNAQLVPEHTFVSEIRNDFTRGEWPAVRMAQDSGLYSLCTRWSAPSICDINQRLMDFMSQFDRPVMAGSSVHFDRAFLREHLPLVESQFHYRNLDVSSIRTFMEACGFSSAPFPLAGKMKHRALPDIINSIDMYASYVKLVTSLANAPTVSP